MKIGKKILAGALAVASTVTIVNATEAIEIEKPPVVSTSAKSKKPEPESIKRKVVKGMTIAAGTAAALTGTVTLTKDIFEICNRKTLLSISRVIFTVYFDQRAKEYVEEHKNTELGEAFIYLFGVFDGKKSVNKWRIIKSYYCVGHCMGFLGFVPRCKELVNSLCEVCGKITDCYLRTLESDNMWKLERALSNCCTTHIYVPKIGKFSRDEYEKVIMRASHAGKGCNLRAILMCNKGNCYHTTICVKNKNGLWNMYFLDGSESKSIDDYSMMDELKKCVGGVNLIYA